MSFTTPSLTSNGLFQHINYQHYFFPLFFIFFFPLGCLCLGRAKLISSVSFHDGFHCAALWCTMTYPILPSLLRVLVWRSNLIFKERQYLILWTHGELILCKLLQVSREVGLDNLQSPFQPQPLWDSVEGPSRWFNWNPACEDPQRCQ